MGLSLIYKILKSHLVEGELKSGTEIGIKIDQTLTQDATGTMAYLQFESIGIPKTTAELSVSYVDHNTLQEGFENADDHLFLKTIAAKYGIFYSKAGNGICHQVHLERFGLPGKTLLGSDSHTPTNGGIASLAIGAGGLDVALAMAGKPFYLTCPKVLNIKLQGRLQKWVSAKDVILLILQKLTTKGNVGSMIEYTGEGIKHLSIPERSTLTNMGAELGVTTSIFPSDEVTRAFLAAQKREAGWVELLPDKDAVYDRVMEIDLSEVEPMAAKPHSPDNVATVKELAGLKVNQVMIGTCTDSSYRNLQIASAVLKGSHVHPDVSAGVVPGSRQVLQMIAESGALSNFISAGLRVFESACGFCIGIGQAPGNGWVSLRTANRNYEGRCGTKNAFVYLVSVETAAASLIKGELTDPRTLGISYPDVASPKKFLVDDSQIIAPPKDSSHVEIKRGPNIGGPLKTLALPDSLEGAVLIKVGDKITTDHILPAGIRMKYRSNIAKYSEFVFEGVDETFSKRARETKHAGRAGFIVGGESYGQGSSREHAAICPAFIGIRAVLAKSFERIHVNNLVNFGIMPLIFKSPSDYDFIKQGTEIKMSSLISAIEKGAPIIAEADGRKIELIFNLSDRQKKIIIAGGVLNTIKRVADPRIS